MEEESDWYKKLGFFENPFNIKPAFFSYDIMGYDKLLEEMFYRIRSSTMSFVEGPLGFGKTSIMLHIINRFKGRKKVAYFACNRIEKDLDIEKLLVGRYGFWGRLFRILPKDMIILLDEVQDFTKVNSERVKNFFDKGNIKSVVFTGTNFNKSGLSPSIKDRIGKQGFVKLHKLTYKDAVMVVKERIGDDEILDNKSIMKVFAISDFNIRRMLQNLDTLCRYVVNGGRVKVRDSDLKKVFGNKLYRKSEKAVKQKKRRKSKK